MAKPDFIPEADWTAVTAICSRFKVDPYFIAAIGWHETHWGKLGAGKIGWILGYGYWPGSTVKDKYKGLYKQVEGACKKIVRDMKLPITLANVINFAVTSWKSSAPTAWARSVFNIYSSLAKGIVPQPTDTEIEDLSKRVEIIEHVVKFFKDLILNLAKEFKSER